MSEVMTLFLVNNRSTWHLRKERDTVNRHKITQSARIHTGFHRFTDIGQISFIISIFFIYIFNNNNNKKKKKKKKKKNNNNESWNLESGLDRQ